MYRTDTEYKDPLRTTNLPGWEGKGSDRIVARASLIGVTFGCGLIGSAQHTLVHSKETFQNL